jgi:mRNA interferase RelE/StbE
MKVEYQKRFLKELAKIPFKKRKGIEEFVFTEVPGSGDLYEIGKVEKMKGYSSHYKVRFGNYRVGLKVVDNKVIFKRVLHRKDIYRVFP